MAMRAMHGLNALFSFIISFIITAVSASSHRPSQRTESLPKIVQIYIQPGLATQDMGCMKVNTLPHNLLEAQSIMNGR